MGCLYGQAIGDALGLGSEGLFRDGVEGYYPKGLTKYEQIVPDATVVAGIRGIGRMTPI